MSLLDAIGSIGSVASSTAAGAASGSVAGPVGTAIGGAIGLASGLYNASQQKKAQGLLPPQVDPNQAAMERYYARMRTAYQTGTAQASQRADLQSTTQEALRNAFKFGGASTDVAGIKSIYLNGLMGLNQQGQQMELGYADRQNQLVGDIAQRKLDIQGAQYQQSMLNATNSKDELGKTTGALLTSLPKLAGVFNGTSDAPTTATPPVNDSSANDKYSKYLANPFNKGNALDNSNLGGSMIQKPALKNVFGLKKASMNSLTNPFALGNSLSNSTL